MKKRIIIIISFVTLILTFAVAEIFSIYHFGNVPTLLTSLYLITIFAILNHLSVSITYVVRKLIKKEKLEIKRIICLLLMFIELLLVLLYIIVIDIDWLNWYAYSSPFYLNVIVRSIEFLLPSIVLIAFSIIMIKK